MTDTDGFIDNLCQKIDGLNENELIDFVKRLCGIDTSKEKDILFCTFLWLSTELILKESMANTLSNGLVGHKDSKRFSDIIFEETTFSEKITMFRKWFKDSENKDLSQNFKNFLDYCSALNDTRNQIFHIKIDNITYNGLSVSKLSTKQQMIKDMLEGRKKMNIPMNFSGK